MGPRTVGPLAWALLQNSVNPVPKCSINDCLVLPGIGHAFVHCFSDINPVIEKFVENSFVEEVAIPVALARSDQIAC